MSRSHLSGRASAFLREHRSEPVPHLSDVSSLPPALRAQIERFVDEFGGLRCTVPGGLLEGELHFAQRDPASLVGRLPDGTSTFVAMEHDTAHCGLLMTDAGRFGSSWTREFGLLFDTAQELVESLALWNQMIGWVHVSVFNGEAADVEEIVGGFAVERVQLGSTSAWWLGSSVAAVLEPSLSPTTGVPSVTLLARDEEAADQLLSQVGPRPQVASGLIAARLRGRVGS